MKGVDFELMPGVQIFDKIREEGKEGRKEGFSICPHVHEEKRIRTSGVLQSRWFALHTGV